MILDSSYAFDIKERIRNAEPEVLAEIGKTSDEILDNEDLIRYLWIVYQKDIEEYGLSEEDAYKDALNSAFGIEFT